MSEFDTIPTWGWGLGAAFSYALLIRVQPMRELFGRGFQIIKRYRHLPISFGLMAAAHALWLWMRGEPPIAAPSAASGLAPLNEIAPFALLGMTEGAFRPFLVFLAPAPVSALLLAVFAVNLFGLLRELRDGIEALVRPKSALMAMALIAASGVIHLGHVTGVGEDTFWNAFLLSQGGALFEGFVSVLGQSYVVLFAALGLVTLRRNLKKKEILKIAVRRVPRLWPLIIAYAAVLPSIRHFLPPDSTWRLALTACLSLVAIVFAFLQLDLLGEKRFSGWHSSVRHALDLQRRHARFTIWFALICMVHWLVFHLVTALLISGLSPSSHWAALAGAVFRFPPGGNCCLVRRSLGSALSGETGTLI